MINLNKGVSTPIALTIIIVLAIGLVGGLYYYFQKQTLELNCGTFRISLPSDWEKSELMNSGKDGCLYIGRSKNNSVEVMFNVGIANLADRSLYNKNLPPKDFLEKIKNLGEDWISDEYIELFGTSVLKVTMVSKDEKTGKLLLHKDLYFIKNHKFHAISFSTEKENFDKEWLKIEKSIKVIEFFE